MLQRIDIRLEDILKGKDVYIQCTFGHAVNVLKYGQPQSLQITQLKARNVFSIIVTTYIHMHFKPHFNHLRVREQDDFLAELTEEV